MLNNDEFAALFDAYRPRVYAYAVSRCGRRLAEEVVSKTFTVVWRRREALPAKAPLPWLLGVAHNVIRELYRDELRQAALDEALRGWTEELKRDVADQVAERALALKALSTLSDADKEVLTLVSWHGLTSALARRSSRHCCARHADEQNLRDDRDPSGRETAVRAGPHRRALGHATDCRKPSGSSPGEQKSGDRVPAPIPSLLASGYVDES